MKKLKRTAAGLLLAGVMCVQALPMTAWAVDMTNSEAVVATDTTPTIVETTTSTATDVRCDIDQTDYFTFNPKQITTNRKTKSQSKSRIYLKQFLLNRQFRRIFQTILSQKKTKLYAQSLSRQQVRKQRKCHHSFLNNFLSR